MDRFQLGNLWNLGNAERHKIWQDYAILTTPSESMCDLEIGQSIKTDKNAAFVLEL